MCHQLRLRYVNIAKWLRILPVTKTDNWSSTAQCVTRIVPPLLTTRTRSPAVNLSSPIP